MTTTGVQGDADDESHQGFLTPTRIAYLGEHIAPLIHSETSWIERRKESVEILDDTSLRRQVSVDFSLRRQMSPLPETTASDGSDLYYAPAFVLPKAPANLMAFDLEDEVGSRLSLIGRRDNARISGEALAEMARELLRSAKRDEPDGLIEELQRIAEADADAGEQLARQLLDAPSAPWEPAVQFLRQHPRFDWWTRTLSHSSVLVVLFRAAEPGRKLLKLRYEQPIKSEQTLMQRAVTTLGWAPYEIAIDSPSIEANRYHLEVAAPPGLRISEASLSDDSEAPPESESGLLRRIHLYRPEAATAGAGTGVLRLRVSGSGFIGGAPLAAGLTVIALLVCMIGASRIAANPTSAPALLLALPGLIATYVGRSDNHALTSRLLVGARGLLALSAFTAYAAAGLVVLNGGPTRTTAEIDERASSLHLWLGSFTAIAVLAFLGLGITWVEARGGFRALAAGGADPRLSSYTVLRLPALFEGLRDGNCAAGVFPDYELVSHNGFDELYYVQRRWHGSWVLTVTLREAETGTIVDCAGVHDSAAQVVPARFFRSRQKRHIEDSLQALQDWCFE